MQPSNWPKRFYSLDAIRGLSAIVIVLWHWMHFTLIGKQSISSFDKTTLPLYDILKPFYLTGTLGTNFFFLLSGFLFFWLYQKKISERTISPKVFWIHRITRLYPLHLVTLLLVIILQLIYVNQYGFYFIYYNFDLYHFVLNLFFMQKWGFNDGFSFNGPSWTVSILVLLYVFFFVLAYFRKATFLICLIISMTAAVLLIADASNYFNRYLLRGITGFFFGGCIFYTAVYLSDYAEKLRPFIYTATVVFWILTLFSIYTVDLTIYIKQLGFIGKLFLEGFGHYILFPISIISLIFLEMQRGALLKKIAWLGDISFSVFLLHFPLQLIFAILVSYGILDRLLFLNVGFFIGFFVLLIGLSYLTYSKFERPMQRYLNQRWIGK
jgi:peptidoglycan/LPS O-acetylase OafA/YrhL